METKGWGWNERKNGGIKRRDRMGTLILGTKWWHWNGDMDGGQNGDIRNGDKTGDKMVI